MEVITTKLHRESKLKSITTMMKSTATMTYVEISKKSITNHAKTKQHLLVELKVQKKETVASRYLTSAYHIKMRAVERKFILFLIFKTREVHVSSSMSPNDSKSAFHWRSFVIFLLVSQ